MVCATCAARSLWHASISRLCRILKRPKQHSQVLLTDALWQIAYRLTSDCPEVSHPGRYHCLYCKALCTFCCINDQVVGTGIFAGISIPFVEHNFQSNWCNCATQLTRLHHCEAPLVDELIVPDPLQKQKHLIVRVSDTSNNLFTHRFTT